MLSYVWFCKMWMTNMIKKTLCHFWTSVKHMTYWEIWKTWLTAAMGYSYTASQWGKVLILILYIRTNPFTAAYVRKGDHSLCDFRPHRKSTRPFFMNGMLWDFGRNRVMNNTGSKLEAMDSRSVCWIWWFRLENIADLKMTFCCN